MIANERASASGKAVKWRAASDCWRATSRRMVQLAVGGHKRVCRTVGDETLDGMIVVVAGVGVGIVDAGAVDVAAVVAYRVILACSVVSADPTRLIHFAMHLYVGTVTLIEMEM